MTNKTKVVVIGGGTGTLTVLQGLKHYPQFDITAIVTMTDSGGSTGRLRDEFGMLPVGDVRQCLVALSKEDQAGDVLRQLFMYRFPSSNSSLAGHNFGNIFLTALTDILGAEDKAILAAESILNISGTILPVTIDNVNIVAEYEDGTTLFGEKNIDEPNPEEHDCTTKITRLWTEPEATIYPRTKTAVEEADFIIIGPGDLYSSLLSNIVIKGMPEAIAKSNAKFIYITNLVSKYGQTHGLKYGDYVAELAKYAGKNPDYILVNNTELPEAIMQKYEAENSFAILDDLGDGDNIIRTDLLSSEEVVKKDGDVLRRSLIRHDSDKLAQEILKIVAK